jgi:site-specific recombinase XerD
LIAENKQALYYYRQNRIRDVCIVSLILASGLRVSEVVHLHLNDIDLHKKIAYVYRKGYAHERTKQGVYFTEAGRQHLRAYLKIREDVYKPARSVKALFLAIPRGKKSGKQMSKRAIQAMVLKYAQVFGKPHLSVHKLRHSFATSYYLRNDIYKTARQLGHVSTDSTQIYAHLSDRTMSKAIDSKG